MWTLVDDDNNTIQVRASLNASTQQDEIRKLIAALEKSLTKEPADDRPATTDV